MLVVLSVPGALFTDAIGYVAAVLTTIAVVPQLYKVVVSKEVEDISITMFIILVLGVASWTLYGILTKDWPVILCNGVSTLLNGSTLVLVVTLKAKSSQRGQSPDGSG